MKQLDYFLQGWRIRKAVAHMRPGERVLDIGCFDGALLKSAPKTSFYVGIDTNLPRDSLHQEQDPSVRYLQGHFPEVMSEKEFLQKFDTIVMLAVFEHIPVANRAAFVASCHDLLKEGGKVIMTIPVPAVDKIIDTLTALKLADGMDLENHEDVPDQVIEDLFSEPKFRRLKKQYFQFGLNRLFVFERALA